MKICPYINFDIYCPICKQWLPDESFEVQLEKDKIIRLYHCGMELLTFKIPKCRRILK
jgi:hypothetical protein